MTTESRPSELAALVLSLPDDNAYRLFRGDRDQIARQFGRLEFDWNPDRCTESEAAAMFNRICALKAAALASYDAREEKVVEFAATAISAWLSEQGRSLPRNHYKDCVTDFAAILLANGADLEQEPRLAMFETFGV